MPSETRTNRIAVRLFGYPEIDPPAKSRVFPALGYCLLALLALTPKRSLTRAQAAAQLWDSGDSSANLANMRQLLLRMQRAMPTLDAVLTISDKLLSLNDTDQLDVCRLLDMDATRSPENIREFMQLYRADLLEGLQVSSPELERTLAVSISYLNDYYFSVISRALTNLTRYGSSDASLLHEIERHSLALDPLRETTYRALIAAYAAVGLPGEAKRIYGLLVSTLKLEQAYGPTPDIQAFFKRTTTRIIDDLEVSETPARRVDARLPRIALLAPQWNASQTSGDNFLRALIEDVANELARYKSFVTLAAHSSFQARHDGGIIRENDALRADYSVASQLRTFGHGELLTVRLVNNASGSIVWSGEFDLKRDLIIASSRLLVARVAAELCGAVNQDVLSELERTRNPSSYLHFLKAQETLNTCDLRSVRRARRGYTDAIRDDNRFAEAYSGLASTLYLEWILLGGNDPTLLSQARDIAELAIRKDPRSSSGYWRKGMVALYQHEFDLSDDCFATARDLHPNSADILLDHSDAMGFVGDANEAWSVFQTAIDLNPTPPDHYWWAGASIAFSKADYQTALDLCGRLKNEEPALRLIAAIHGQLGNTEEARDYGRRVMETYPGQAADEMTRLQPHRSRADLQTFIDGLKLAGIK